MPVERKKAMDCGCKPLAHICGPLASKDKPFCAKLGEARIPRCSQQSLSIARLDDDASGCLVLRPRLPAPVCLNHAQKEDDADCGESGEDFRQLPAELHHYLLLAPSQLPMPEPLSEG